jgi:hypothetical protein
MRRPSTSDRKVTVGLIQTSCDRKPAVNLQRTLKLAERAAKAGAQIICTQELFASLYFCQTEDHKNFALAERIPGPTSEAFQKFAKKHQVVVIASIFEKRAPGLYHNSALVIDADGKLLGMYRKMHIPDDPLYYEKVLFHTGRSLASSWQTKYRADLECSFAGINGTRRRRGSRPCKAPKFSFIQRPSAGIPRRRASMAPPSMPRGRPFSEHTQLPTVATSLLPIVSARK